MYYLRENVFNLQAMSSPGVINEVSWELEWFIYIISFYFISVHVYFKIYSYGTCSRRRIISAHVFWRTFDGLKINILFRIF